MKTFAPIRTTPMYRAHLAHGATFREDGGWKIADRYTSPEDEARRARAGLGLADVSAGGKFAVRGEDVEALCITVTGAPAPPAGLAVRARIDGARALVCRVAADEVLLLTGPAGTDAVLARLGTTADAVGCAHVTDLTSALAVVDLVGPAAGPLLARLVPVDLAPVPPLGVVHAALARVRTTLLRLEHPAGPAFRAVIGREFGEFVWHTLLEAGRDLDIVPVGAAAHALLLAEA